MIRHIHQAVSSPPRPTDLYLQILTGATGFLGAHALCSLVSCRNVAKVYCFVRTVRQGTQSADLRLIASLKAKDFDFPLEKVVSLSANLEDKDFGLDASTLDRLRKETTDIIHCAWPVNFAMPLSAFESQVAGLHSLINLGLQTRQRSQLLFCSSVGVAQSVRGTAKIASAPMPSLEDAAPTGYGQSKLVSERIVQAAAAAGADVTILRIGQIVPGRFRGTKLWNTNEAVPLMIQSSNKNSAGALPILGPGRDACSWLQADTLADAILDIAGFSDAVPEENGHGSEHGKEKKLVYNLVNPRIFSWMNDFIPALRLAGLEFDLVPWTVWLQRLETSTDDAAVNPSRKLFDIWSRQPERQHELTFDVSESVRRSPALRAASTAVEGNFVKQLVNAWRETEYLV